MALKYNGKWFEMANGKMQQKSEVDTQAYPMTNAMVAAKQIDFFTFFETYFVFI